MTGVARVYGQALYELTRDEGLSENVAGELAVLRRILMENPDFIRLVSNPGIAKDERLNVIQESFKDRVHPYVLNFMKLLTEKGYMHSFAACCDVYRECYNIDHNILPVKVTSAASLTEEQAQRLSAKLADITGKQIELDMHIDPACLGGMRLDYDGKRIDDTISGRIERLHNMLKNTTL